MNRGLTLLIGVILLLALAGYVLHERMRAVAFLLWGLALLLILLTVLIVAGLF